MNYRRYRFKQGEGGEEEGREKKKKKKKKIVRWIVLTLNTNIGFLLLDGKNYSF